MSLLSLFPSRTVGMALTVLPLLSRAFDLSKADDWVYDKLPESFKANGTFQEFQAILRTGKDFLSACYEFLHK